MLRVLGLVISIGLVDSLNPSTIAPALYLAAGDKARIRVTEFTIAVFAVYFLGGALIAIGPGQLIRSLLPHLTHTVRDIAEIVAGVTLLVGAGLVWQRREGLVGRGMPATNPQRRSSVLLGATITVVELPTAFPYFAAIATIAGSGLDPARQVMLLVIFNVCFILPLIGIIATLTFAGPRSDRVLSAARNFLERRWPHILAWLLLIIGVAALLLGSSGLAARGHSRVGRFFRHVRHFLHLHP